MSEIVAPSEEDGFLKTLASLKEVIQPDTQLQKKVHVLQKENRTLFEKLENLRQESHEQLQASQQALQEERKEWERQLQAEKQQAQQDRSAFEADLENKTARLNEIETEKRLVVGRVEEERRGLEESMIQLESENKSLKERCTKSEAMGAKLQAEVSRVIHCIERCSIDYRWV